MATYYWVGGTGTWDASSTTNWSASSGGAGGSGPPNNTDTVIFDSASGTGTCTTASGSACAIATLDSSTLGLTLGANHTMSGTFTLTLGTLSLGSNTLTCSIFSSSNANIRSIAFGTGQISLTGNGSNIFNISTATNFSITGTSLVEVIYAGSSSVSITGGQTSLGGTEANAINFRFSAGSYPLTFNTGRVYRDITFTSGYSGTVTFTNITVFGNITLAANLTVAAIANSITLAATSGTQQITTAGKTIDQPIVQNSPGATVQLQDNLTMGSTRTYTLTAGTLDLSSGNRTLSSGLFSSTNSNVRSIAFGTGNITLTQNGATIWNTSTVTNFSYTGTPTVNLTYAGSTGTRSISTGVLTEAQVVSFNISAGSDIISGPFASKNLNFTGFTGTWTNTSRQIYGNLTISNGMTVGSGANLNSFLATSGTQQITTNGQTLDFPLTFNGIGGTVAFQDALTQGSTRNFTIANGTVQLKNGVTSTVGNFVATNSNVKFLQSTTPGSQATLSQASGTVNVVDLTIRDINAVGGASWNAYTDFENTDAGNNDGWNFSLSPPYSTAELPVTLRPFTQPRRF